MPHQNANSTACVAPLPISTKPGQNFAILEARVILARILKEFKFRLVPGQKVFLPEQFIVSPLFCGHFAGRYLYLF